MIELLQVVQDSVGAVLVIVGCLALIAFIGDIGSRP